MGQQVERQVLPDLQGRHVSQGAGLRKQGTQTVLRLGRYGVRIAVGVFQHAIYGGGHGHRSLD